MAHDTTSDDDDISITSSKSENWDGEYTVVRILAEKVEKGQKYYLIQWLDYPEEENSWEPPENIEDEGLIEVWKERKLRESKGIDKPYDVAKYEVLRERWIEEKANRHSRRRAKR